MSGIQPSSQSATMKDVARLAGVGVGTVSRVFSNKGSVSSATRERVEEAARQLHFRPSALGRGLKSQRTNNIGLIVTDISNSFYGEFAEGVLATARGSGRHVLVAATREDVESERECIELLLEQRVEGIIAFPTGGNVDLWKSASALGIRIVFADRLVEGLDFPSVLVDNAAGAKALTEYALALGHRSIGYLGGPLELTSGYFREQGFRQAHADAGVALNEHLIVRGKFTSDTAYASALRLLESHPRPTALIASNNVLGQAALTAIKENGLRVPGDISLLMFDDLPWANLVDPPITVISQPAWRMGRAATALVTSQAPLRDSKLVIETRLIIRGSAAPWLPRMTA